MLFPRKKKTKPEAPKIAVRFADSRGHHNLTAFEKTVHLQTFVKYILSGGREVGAMLLNRGTQQNPNYILRFGWETPGFHEIFSPEQARATVSSINSVMAELPFMQSLRIQQNIFANSVPRELELVELFDGAPDDNCRILLGEELKINQDLHDRGICRPKEIFLYAAYEDVSTELEPLEQAIDFALNKLGKLSKAEAELQQLVLDKFLLRGYEQGFCAWQNLFGEKLKTDTSPLTDEELLYQCYLELNRFVNPHCQIVMPQVIVFDLVQKTIKEVKNSRLSPVTNLIKHPSSIPVAHRDRVEVDGKHVGCLFLAEHPQEFIYEDGDERSLEEKQLKYLWDWLSRPSSQNMKIVVEIRKPSVMSVKKSSVDKIREIQNAKNAKEDKGQITEADDVKLKRALQVERDLASNAVVIEFGLVAFVYRDNPESMRAACRELYSYFNSPASMFQDIDTPYSLWANALPFSGGDVLVDFAGTRDRRDRTYAIFMPALVPMLNTVSPHKSGFFFVAANGGSPIYFDPYKHQGHTAIYGESRSGKSLYMAHKIYAARLRNMPAIVLDFPPSGKASTFKDFIQCLGGSYFDVFNHCINILQTPEIPRGLDAGLVEDFIKDTRVAQQDLLVTVVLGAEQRAEGRDSLLIKSLIGQVLDRFWQDDEILEMHRAAREGGLGSPAWQDYPVLHRNKKACLTRLCSVHHLDIDNPTSEIIDTLHFIKQRLVEFAISPHGRNLSRPSSFNLDSPLIAIAMRGKVDNDLAAVFGSVMFNLAYRMSVQAAGGLGSVTVVDESAIVFENPSIARAAGATAANGLKAGMHLILAAQTPAKVLESAGGKSFAANIFYNLVGRVQSADIDSYKKHLGLSSRLLVPNTKFPKPTKELGFSQWLLSLDGTVAHGRIYLPPRLVNLTANNINEVQERNLDDFALKPKQLVRAS